MHRPPARDSRSPCAPEESHPLAARYDAIWEAGAARVLADGAQVDPWLARRVADRRRGLTLLARPSPAVAERVAAFAGDLRALEPAQYYQPPGDLHFTVLSLFTATPDPEPHLARVPDYADGVAAALAEVRPFVIDARGVTLSSAAVLVQGFPSGNALAAVRDGLRAALTGRGLGGTLDGRYRLETAHMTAARFAAPLRAPGAFVAALAAARRLPFGTTLVARLDLVVGDWYHSAEHERVVATYHLAE